jgi:hypothetical protein
VSYIDGIDYVQRGMVRPMTGTPPRPLLFLDVDGTLLPYADGVAPDLQQDWDAWQHESNPLLARLVPGYGPRLLALDCDLVWATAWRDDANDVIAPRLGLPRLPVLELPTWTEECETAEPHWKVPCMVELAGGRPFIWVDDEIRDADQGWVSANHPGRALLHRVDPGAGLTEADFAVIERWLAPRPVPVTEPAGAGRAGTG